MVGWLELTNEPVVVKTPPNVISIVDDAWLHYVANVGQVAEDKNKGGTYLVLPPGHEGEIPDRYICAHVADLRQLAALARIAGRRQRHARDQRNLPRLSAGQKGHPA
jgi:hypothetical protein